MVAVAMSSSSSTKLKYQQNTWRSGLLVEIIVVVLVLCLVSLPSGKKDMELSKEAVATVSVKSESDGEPPTASITLEEVHGIPYYHCRGMGSDGDGTIFCGLGSGLTKSQFRESPK